MNAGRQQLWIPPGASAATPPTTPKDLLSPAPTIRPTAILALATIIVGFGGFFTWAATADLASAAVAPAVVAVESHRKVVQHLEGGIVKAVRVANGDHVRADDVLVELDDTQAGAAHGQTLGQYRAALARQARLRAEAGERGEIDFPAALLTDRGDPEITRVIEAQTWTFTARRNAHESAIAVKRQAQADLTVDITATTDQLKATERQIQKIREEIEDVRGLLLKGLVPKPRLLALERAHAELDGRVADLLGRIARNREAMTAVTIQIGDLNAVRQKEIATDLEAVEKEVADLEQRLTGLQHVLQRTLIRAPQDGVVVNLQIFTPGGVIRGGEPIMEIVPGSDALVVDAKVSPMDIDSVHAGLTARLRLSAYKQRSTPTVQATVVDVSADRLTDQAGNTFYTARLRIDPGELERLPFVRLAPGMPVDAMILTGERTALDYLLAPITDNFAHALREQ